MEFPLNILALFGFVAALLRLTRAAVSVLRRGAEAFFAREVAETRARRGDITGMEKAQGAVMHARRERRRSLGLLVLWAALVILPPVLLPSPAPVYAAYNVLWLLPRLDSWRQSTESVRNRL